MILRDAMVHTFPPLADARIDYCWGGQVDMTLDRMVKAGQHNGVHYSMGYAGHGVQMATYMGRQMAEYMSGVPEANIWSDFAFRRIPGHFGPPWFLPFAGAYYKFKDRVG
jgi:glycine/D-amino acid oxidase-like deaminating enzyme